MRTRAQLTLGLFAVAIVAGGGYIAIAGPPITPGSRDGGSSVQAQGFQHTSTPASTSSGSFANVPGLTAVDLCGPKEGVSATVSLDVSGGPLEVRVAMRKRGKDRVLFPRAASFDPGSAAATSFSFTFVREFRRKLSESFDVEWRATTAEPVTLHRGSIRLLYGVKRRQNCA